MNDALTAIIPQGLDDADNIIFGRTGTDIIFGIFLPVFLVILLAVFGLIGRFGLLAGLVWTMGITIILFRKAGPGTPVSEYLKSQIHTRRLTSTAVSFPLNGTSEDRHNHTIPDGGRFEGDVEDFTTTPENVSVWQEEQETAEFTRVKNVYPQFNAIERADGAFITAIKIDGTDIYLRSTAARNQLASRFTAALNKLDIPLQIFITTDHFDIESHTDVHSRSASHPDVKNNPILNKLHEGYRENVIDDPRIQNTQTRDTYAIVTVTPQDVEDSPMVDNDDGRDIAIVEFIKGLLNRSDPTFDESELNKRKVAIDMLADRQKNILRRLNSIDSISAAPADYETHLGEIRGHWRGPVRSHPVKVPASPIVPPENMVDSDTGGLLN